MFHRRSVRVMTTLQRGDPATNVVTWALTCVFDQVMIRLAVSVAPPPLR